MISLRRAPMVTIRSFGTPREPEARWFRPSPLPAKGDRSSGAIVPGTELERDTIEDLRERLMAREARRDASVGHDAVANDELDIVPPLQIDECIAELDVAKLDPAPPPTEEPLRIDRLRRANGAVRGHPRAFPRADNRLRCVRGPRPPDAHGAAVDDDLRRHLARVRADRERTRHRDDQGRVGGDDEGPEGVVRNDEERLAAQHHHASLRPERARMRNRASDTQLDAGSVAEP